MTKVYEILEICLKEIERGADVDTVLFRYPEFEKELRPLLEASVKAKEMAVGDPSEEAVRRSRAKVLQRAAHMREAKAAPASRRVWSVPLRRALVTLAVVAMLFVSGTGLVRASSSSLPGDNLYPVKRAWEGLSLFFTFDVAKREALEFEHENERLKELRELIAKGRSAEVEFAGYVTRQSADEWRVSGVTVFVSPGTRLPEQPVAVGAAVRVKGRIQNNGVVAERIEALPPGYRLPEGEDEDNLEIEEEEGKGANQPIDAEPVTGSATEAPKATATVTSTPNPTPKRLSIEGVLSSMTNNFVTVNGTLINIQFAEVKGTPFVGAVVKAEGYFDAAGVFIAAKIEFKGAPPGSAPPTSNENGSEDDNGNRNDNGDDNGGGGNDNDNDDDNENDNGDDDADDND
ncbi:MAG: DUF5666 domain-containing protein [Anaerolineales bacterium]|nr:DUF5666 domain-containing protein [Anaerolineales bacterium]NUQ83416.1 hypothetical protein [Anaerolineales bacterium]